MKTTSLNLDTISRVLIRCFWIGVGFQVVFFLLFMAGAEAGYGFHKNLWTGLTRHEYDLIALCFLAFMKTCVFCGFLVPYLAIRLYLKGDNSGTPEAGAV